MKSLKHWEWTECTSKSFECNLYFSVVGSQMFVQVINWVKPTFLLRHAFRENVEDVF